MLVELSIYFSRHLYVTCYCYWYCVLCIAAYWQLLLLNEYQSINHDFLNRGQSWRQNRDSVTVWPRLNWTQPLLSSLLIYVTFSDVKPVTIVYYQKFCFADVNVYWKRFKFNLFILCISSAVRYDILTRVNDFTRRRRPFRFAEFGVCYQCSASLYELLY